MADYFSPRAPESFTVTSGSQVCISRRPSSKLYTSLYITNNSDKNVYLGFTGPTDTVGNAKPNHGITVFPKSTVSFEDPILLGCAVWATCDEGEAIIGVQQ